MKLLTVKDIASILKAKPSTIYAWAEQGLMPCFKLNGLLRFEEGEVLKWLESCKKQSYTDDAGRRPKKGGQL